jgi:hypothetical protein
LEQARRRWGELTSGSFQEIVHENIVEGVHERVEETVNEVGNDMLVDDEVSDDLDQMIHDGEPEFLDARNLK